MSRVPSVTWISFPGGGLAEGSGTLVLCALSMPSLVYTSQFVHIHLASCVCELSTPKKNHSSRLCFTPPFLSLLGEGCNFYLIKFPSEVF